jgi:predicted CXXCH cytochrome family protein
MDSFRSMRVPTRPGRRHLVALVIAAALAGTFGSSGRAQESALSDPDKACLGCHGMQGMDKKATNGDLLSLHIPPDPFAKSVHTAVGCTGCHYDIKADAHPANPKEVASARAYAIAAVQTCRNCHDDKFKEWDSSIHASLVHDGNPAAPICSACHNPHAVIKNAAATMESVPCKGCHADVYEAYAGSVHGKLRENGQIAAPLCAGCHTAHSITAANVAMEAGLKSICTGCHADVYDKHKTWLPNAALHFEVVSCPACHAPGVPRQVDLKLVDQATQKRIAEQSGVPHFEASVRAKDGQGTGLDPVAVWTLLRSFQRDNPVDKTVLLGRLEVQKGPDAHKLTAKGKAIGDCSTCHRQGAEAFQTVSLSVARPDGRLVRYGAQSDVLSSIVSMDSIKGFYALGATRIHLLDYLVILALLGGAAIPIGHLALGWFVRRAHRRGAAKA